VLEGVILIDGHSDTTNAAIMKMGRKLEENLIVIYLVRHLPIHFTLWPHLAAPVVAGLSMATCLATNASSLAKIDTDL
jgi:hypothetical protein